MFKLKKKHYWFDKGFRNCHLWHGESLEITLTVPSIKTFSKSEYNLNNEAHSLKLQFTSISLCHCILNGLPAKTADILLASYFRVFLGFRGFFSHRSVGAQTTVPRCFYGTNITDFTNLVALFLQY